MRKDIKNIKVLSTLLVIVLFFSCADNELYNDSFFEKTQVNKSKKYFINTTNKGVTPASKYYLKTTPLVEYIIDDTDKNGKNYSKHIKKVCDYAKIPFRKSNSKRWNSPNFKIAKSTRVVCMNNAKVLNDNAIKELLNFISRGGTLFLSSIVADERLNYLYGLKLNSAYEIDYNASGFKFTLPILPNHKGKTNNINFKHQGLKHANFINDVVPLVVAANNAKYPVILENYIGEGSVIFLNSNMMIDKNMRGMVFSILLSGLEGIPYPIANVSTIYLDDFPSPVYNIIKEPIASEMGMSMSEFVDKVWWPDMLKLSKEFDINYTTGITFDYSTNVTPPFIFTEWERNKKGTTNTSLSNWFTYSALKNNHELGLHGYNHVSLQKSDWKNTDYITTALKTVTKKWKVDNYGTLPVTYIPPSNMIDSIGLAELKTAMPSVKYMSSSYFGIVHEGEGREFDIDPYNPKLFDYPRVTFEYLLNDQKHFTKESLYLFTGIWTHFVHPDDVFQIKDESNKKTAGNYAYRNALGLGWYTSKDGSPGLFPRFRNILASHKNIFPKSRFLKASDGAKIVNIWRSSSYQHQELKELYSVNKKGGSNLNMHYWFAYTSNSNLREMETYLKSNNITYSKTPLLKGYLINAATKLPLLKVPNIKPLLSTDDLGVSNLVFTKYSEYLKELKNKKDDTLVEVKEYNEEEEYAKEIKLLKEKMFANKVIDTISWNRYARLKNWKNNSTEVWKKLDTYYELQPCLTTAMYADKLAKISWYPTEKVKEKWLLAQIKLDSSNIKLLNKYVDNYNTKNNSKRIAGYLKRITELSKNSTNINNYIKHILWGNKTDVYNLLNTITPSKEYNEVASEVAWFYHEKGDIEKAYEWANISDDIPFAIKLDWLNTLEDYDRIEKVYKAYVLENPNDNKAKAAMAYIYHKEGDFKKSWVVSNSISEGYEGKTALKKMLNQDVKYIDKHLQNELITTHSELFKTEIKDSLIIQHRIKTSNSIALNGVIASDRSNNTSFEKTLTYTVKNKKDFSHGMSLSNSNIYALNTDITDLDNVDRDLYGLQYQLNNPFSYDQLQYWTKVRIEKDNANKMYFQFGVGGSTSKSTRFSSIAYNLYPVKNGVAHSRGIYRNQLGAYYEKHFMKALSGIGNFESNYYTDKVLSAALSGKITYSIIKNTLVNIYPYLESEYSLGTKNRPAGYPYWIINNRVYGGGGVGFKYGVDDQSKIVFTTEAAHFIDDYSDSFSRFTGKTSIRILKYYLLQASFEYYIQSEYYSNRFNFGLKYNLK